MSDEEKEDNILLFPGVAREDIVPRGGIVEKEDKDNSLPTAQDIWDKLMEEEDIDELVIVSFNSEGKLGFISNFESVAELVYAMDRVKNTIMNG